MKDILDVCCGSRMFWFDKNNPAVIFNDIRDEEHILCDGRKLEIHPDTHYDFRSLGFASETFSLVVFDPPHVRNIGKSSWMYKKYGKLEETWKEDIRKGFEECWRVLKENGVLIFKWNEESFTIKQVLDILPVQPLFGHTTSKHGKTKWMCFMKFSPETKDS